MYHLILLILHLHVQTPKSEKIWTFQNLNQKCISHSLSRANEHGRTKPPAGPHAPWLCGMCDSRLTECLLCEGGEAGQEADTQREREREREERGREDSLLTFKVFSLVSPDLCRTQGPPPGLLSWWAWCQPGACPYGTCPHEACSHGVSPY